SDLVVKVEPTSGGLIAPPTPDDQLGLFQRSKRLLEAGRRLDPRGRAEPEHDSLRASSPGRQLLVTGLRWAGAGRLDVLPGPGDVPPPPGALAVGRVGMGTGTRPVDRPAVPVRLIVSGAAGLESPARDLVAIEPRGAEQAVRGVQLIPLGIAVHL